MLVFSQVECPVMPNGLLCVTQAAGNRAAELAHENPALQAKIVVLENALLEKDKSIKELKDTGRINVDELKKTIHTAEVKLATAAGQIIELEADKVRWTAVIDVLVKGQKKKCMPFSVCLF